MNKYINLVSMSAWTCGWGVSTYRRRPNNPSVVPLSCVTGSQTLGVNTAVQTHSPPPHPHPDSHSGNVPLRICHPRLGTKTGGGGARLALWSDRLPLSWCELRPEVRGQRGHKDKSADLLLSAGCPSPAAHTEISCLVMAAIWRHKHTRLNTLIIITGSKTDSDVYKNNV